MDLQEILQSPQIEIRDISEFTERSYRKRDIINETRHREIVDLAEDNGIFDLFRRQLPFQSSRSLYFFKQLYEFTKIQDDLELYEHHVDSFEWDDSDEKYSSYVSHWLVLCEELRDEKYFEKVRDNIDSVSSYMTLPEAIAEEISSNRRSEITHQIMHRASKRKVEKARRKALQEPSKKEVEKVIKRLCSLKLSKAFESASKLYSVSGEIEDLSRAVDTYNSYFECENSQEHSSFWFNAKRGLVTLLQSTRRNAIREEYKEKALDEAKEDWMVGTSFSDIKDLFLMTRLAEDRESTDGLVDRGIALLKRGVSTNFSNFTEELFDLFKATRDRAYLDKYESMTVSKNGKKRHPAYMGEAPLTALPIFEVTGDTKYITEIEAHCQFAIEKREYRTAESIYFRMFELTGNQQYFDKAREMLEITKEQASEEKPILGPLDFFNALDKTLNAQSKTQEVLTGEDHRQSSIIPSLEYMNELEVSVRIGSDIQTLLRYASKVPNQDDIDSLRKNISLLDEMKNGSSMNLGHLFDLYQITGDRKDFDKIGDRFESYVSEEHDLIEDEDMLKEITYEGDY